MEQDDAIAAERPAERQPVAEYDMYFDERFTAGDDYHAGLARLNDETPPVFWTEAQGGHWVIRSREPAYEASRDTELFSSRAMNIPANDGDFEIDPAIPIMLDPPLHGTYRRPLTEIFSAPRMAKMERRVREFAVELIEAVRGAGRCDFVEAVSEPLPVLTFMDLVGFDSSRLKEFRDLAITGSVHPDPMVKAQAGLRVAEIMSAFVEERLANPRPQPQDLADEIVRLQIDGRPITPDEMKGYCRLMFFAGLDTVVNSMAFGIGYLARNSEAQARMRANPAEIKAQVEELLRLGGPVQPGRYVTRDQVWHGVQLRKGDRALICLPSANLDARAFPDPLKFDPQRPNISHLTFNGGPHRCVGQHLARIELQVMYEEWLARIPPFRLDPDRPARFHGGMVIGVDSLPIIWE